MITKDCRSKEENKRINKINSFIYFIYKIKLDESKSKLNLYSRVFLYDLHIVLANLKPLVVH